MKKQIIASLLGVNMMIVYLLLAFCFYGLGDQLQKVGYIFPSTKFIGVIFGIVFIICIIIQVITYIINKKKNNVK